MSQLLDELNLILQEKQDKIKPENIKKGVQIFDIEGIYEGDSTKKIKLFETQEDMQNDEDAKEGDLAVVYREEIQNMTADSQTQYLTFPETVTLPQALTESYYCMLRSVDSSSSYFDGNVMLDQNSFRFDGYTESGMIRVQYTSADGITYNRTRFTGDSGDLTNPVDLGIEIHCEMQEEWNDNFGYFMQTGGNTFEGLFKNTNITTGYGVTGYSNITSDDSTITATEEVKSITNWLDKINSLVGDTSRTAKKVSIIILDNIPYLYDYNMDVWLLDNTYMKLENVIINSTDDIVLKSLISDDTLTLPVDTNYYRLFDGDKWYFTQQTFNSIPFICNVIIYQGIPYYNVQGMAAQTYLRKLTNKTNTMENISYLSNNIIDETALRYIHAQTQLSLSEANELLSGKIAYGKEGIVTGDDTLYDNLNNDTLTNTLFNDISDLPNLFLLSTANRQYKASNLVLKLVADITKSGDILCGKELVGKLIPSNCTTFLYSLDKKVFYCGGFNVVTADLNAKTINLNNYEEQAKGLGCNFNDYISFSYLDKVNNIIYGYFNTTDWDLIKLYKIENNTMYVISDEINTQVSSLITFTYRIIGYDNINKLLYILKAANASTNSEIITINEANEINSSTTINTYSTRISTFETQNYIWYSVSDYDDVNKGIRYLRKGTNNWTYLDIPYYQASYGFELDNGNIIISTYSSKSSNRKSIEINLNTSQIINESSAKCLSYNNYISRDLDGNLYTYQEMYTSNGIFVKELLSYGYADLSLDIPIIFLPNGVSNSNFNSSIAEGYYIKNQTPFNSSEGILYKYYKNNWKQLNDYNFSSLEAKE